MSLRSHLEALRGSSPIMQAALPTKPPAWADKTCEHCIYRIDTRCRRAISSYGYAQVVNHGRYQLACSFHQEATR